MYATGQRREDIFVSVGVTGSLVGPDAQQKLRDLAARIGASFRFWEMLVVDDAAHVEADGLGTMSIPNIRLLKVRPTLPDFNRRLCLAREAIGNIVVLTSIDEIDQVAIPDLIEQSETARAIITLRRQAAIVLNPLVVALGRSAGFRVDLRDMATVVLPRSSLDRLLRHPDAPLALRFTPVDVNLPVRIVKRPYPPRQKQKPAIRRLGDRLNILRQLTISSTPRVLSVVELASVVIAIGSVVFAFYALTVWLTYDLVQPGWLTTSLLLSMIALFLSLSIFGLSTGLERLLALVADHADDDLLDEVNAIDIFRDTMFELNIERDDAPDQTATAGA